MNIINEIIYLRGIAVGEWSIAECPEDRQHWNQQVTAFDAYLEGRTLTPLQTILIDAEIQWHKDKLG